VLHNFETFKGSPARPQRALVLTVDDLPPKFNRRWTSPSKALVLEAIDIGLLSLNEAASRYALQLDDIQSWRTEATRSPSPIGAATPHISDTRVTRLGSILLLRGLIDQEDADYIGGETEQTARFRLDAIMATDDPIF
jgi:hypothetical protein